MRNAAHMETKRKVKKITVKTQFEEMLQDAMLSEEEKQIMRLYYIEKRGFSQIAGDLGLSESCVIKKHRKILTVIASLI